ncbi:NIC-domain-containing protein [Sporormia fimetaria CBS 119925]|uniref:NIC-domain-containing protein n=1 Tax=Sporormia fimetaria CBS 119925 TaxID=1340428 RepID=A0A6A6VBT8_9PLEO|nr:NIC-domain-containing protein [Sporormia fimetaria CBS 119925]
MSSLFANLGGNKPASNTPATSGLFGTGTASSAPAANTTSAPSLFSNIGATSSAAPSGGLFSNLSKPSAPSGTAPPASTGGLGSSLFGGTTAATTAPASSGTGLFGATSTAQPKPTLGGLFSATPANAQQSNTANPLSNTQQTAAAQPSLFATTTAPQSQQPAGNLAQSNAPGPGKSAHFDHLLERGRKRNAGEHGITNFEELPTLQLGLGDIARKVRNLGTGGPSADQVQDRAAHYLLSASGVKLGSTLRDLNQFSTQAGLSAAGAATVPDTDVDGYLSNLHSQSTLALIQEGLEQSKRDFDSFLEDNVQIEWDTQRKRIYEHFGLGRQNEEMAASQASFGRSTGRGAFGRSTRKARSMGPNGASTNGTSFAASASASVLGAVNSPYRADGSGGQDKSMSTGQAMPPDRFVRERQERFAERVRELNVRRLEEKPYPVLQSFSDVEKASEIDHQDHLINTYKALVSITGEADQRLKERGLAEDYLDENSNWAGSINIRKRILTGSRTFLEKKFFDEAVELVAKHASAARPGGIPSSLNKIKGYIAVKLTFKEFGDLADFQTIAIEGGTEYPWLTIFYLLRSGLLNEAVEYIRARKNFFQSKDRYFAAALVAYAEDSDRRLNADLQQKISQVYAQGKRIGPSPDPYRMACYKIIGRCEISRRNLEGIPQQNMDDWVWLQFNLAREVNRAEENAGELFGLNEIRASVHDIYQRHFSSSSEAAGGYGVYFYLAMLAGMFEHAVNYLYQFNYTSAVHYAIALDYYGLLRVSNWSKAGSEIFSVTFTQRQQPELNFGRIVGAYTGDFRAARADSAAEYLVLICLNADLPGEAGKEQANLCHEALRELVLETREFSTLLGDVKANGEATLGLIQQRISLIKLADEAALIRNITQEAAKTADDNGRTNDAVLLCHLAGEYDLVVSILNRSLSEALSVDLGQEPMRLEPLKQRLSSTEPNADRSSSSNSMLGTDDPIELARRVIELYDANPLWWRNVTKRNRETVGVLIKLNMAKSTLEQRKYMETLDSIRELKLLPLDANGDLSLIRHCANLFATLPAEIARNIGNVLLWCIHCCSRHREVLLNSQFDDPTRRALANELLQKARDLMVFTGLIRYKLPPRVFETLAREGGDAGAGY